MNETPGDVRLIGGEMLLWSDADAVTDWRGVGLELAGRLVPAGGRVLLAGPHAAGLVAAVTDRAGHAAVLVRSYPDACALGELHPSLTVHCGRLRALTEEPYDLVLALDGLGRTYSAEEPAPSWQESFEALAGLVAPGGRLVLAVPNDLGVDRFVEARPPDRQGADDHWEPHGFDPTHPGGPDALDTALAAAGLVTGGRYAAYPGRAAPRALLSGELLAQELPEALTVPLAAREGDTMLVADPLRLTRLAFRHGLGEHLAPLWVTVAARPAGRHPDQAPDEPACLPAGLVEVGRVVHEVTATTTRRLPDGSPRPIPRGRVLEEVLVEACAREDVRSIRHLLARLADWVEDGGDAPADNLVWDGERFAAVTPQPAPTGPVATRVVLCRILWRFAVRLLASGHHHPWPWPQAADQLALTLCGMAGRPCDDDELDRARKLDAELGQPALPPGAAPAYRDLLADRDRLADRLTAALARVTRLETKLTYRERELVRARARLRRTRRKAAALRRTLGHRLSRRLSRRLARPRKAARKMLRLLSG
ncbi:class I SAM-dependent methyltransferase [Nonomuraea sp. NPDC047897]|uniref:class I SAM-dependent methyltransferase n=1 Tax=Nonomuraea sp. NPDC047897 TaxID=3364346 RepID=UPI003722AE94